MISQTLRVLLLVGLLILPPAAAAVAIDVHGAAAHHGPVICGPGYDC